MSDGALWAVVVAMGVLTFALRSSFILAQERIRLPDWVRRGLDYVPAAVLAAIVAPAFVQLGGDAELIDQAPGWAAGIVGVVVALKTRHIVAVMVAGMLTLWGARALLG